jgi:LysM repeat protein
MKQKIICFLTAILCFSAFSFAQETLKTQTIDGIEYYVYSVKQSEGLFRISQNFGVSQEEIMRLNPEVKDGLRAGQIIFIPKVKDVVPTTAQTPTQPTQPSANVSTASSGGEPSFIHHRVERQQTLFSVSRQYDVTQDDIIRFNPQAANGLREGEILRIPKSQAEQAEKAQENLTARYLTHKVEAGETLFSISRKYNVTQEDITKLNPDLEVLSIGRELKIPLQSASSETETANRQTATTVDWVQLFPQATDNVKSDGKLHIAFLLPFSLENRNNNDAHFLDFYAGAVMAISEARARGISLDIYTFDTGITAERMADVFRQNPVLKEVDLIIGPAWPVQVPAAMQFAQTNRVKTLIPFTSRVSDAERNPWIFQFNPGMDAELELLRQVLDTRFSNANIVFAELANVPETDEGAIISQQIKEILNERGRRYSVTLPISSPDNNAIEAQLVRGRNNLIIFNTNQFQMVQPHLANLNAVTRNFDITLFERYRWKPQETQRPTGVYIAPFRPERDMFQLNQYNRNFVNLFGWEATSRNPRYDILGYDLVSYFIELLNSTDEKEIMNKLELEPHRNGLQSQFRFVRRSLDSGFVNQQMYLGNSQVR